MNREPLCLAAELITLDYAIAARAIDQADWHTTEPHRRLATAKACVASRRTQNERFCDVAELLPRFDSGGRLSQEGSQASVRLDGPSQETLRACVRTLPDSHRIPLVLADGFGLDFAISADLLGIPAELMRQRLHEARLALMAMIERLRPPVHVVQFEETTPIHPYAG